MVTDVCLTVASTAVVMKHVTTEAANVPMNVNLASTLQVTGNAIHVKCKNGTFGKDCTEHCIFCMNGDCNTLDGTCRSGCMKGYSGQFCTV
ncbi:hypothetical protein MAR_022868, partial [Mya arenaria]